MKINKSLCVACGRRSSTWHQFGPDPGALYIFECERKQCRATSSYQSAPFMGSFALLLKEPYR